MLRNSASLFFLQFVITSSIVVTSLFVIIFLGGPRAPYDVRTGMSHKWIGWADAFGSGKS